MKKLNNLRYAISSSKQDPENKKKTQMQIYWSKQIQKMTD